MVILTEKEAKAVASIIEGYTKSPDGQCMQVYCPDQHTNLQQVLKKIRDEYESVPNN